MKFYEHKGVFIIGGEVPDYLKKGISLKNLNSAIEEGYVIREFLEGEKKFIM